MWGIGTGEWVSNTLKLQFQKWGWWSSEGNNLRIPIKVKKKKEKKKA